MPRTRLCLAGLAAALVVAGCMDRDNMRTQTAAGDIAVDSLSATRTALLRVVNNYPTKVRVYTVLGGQLNEVASVMPNDVRTVVLDPNLIPNRDMSFELRPVDGGGSTRLGPFSIYKDQT